jgi:hypothetical protein
MIIWKIEFEYQLDGEDEWRPDGALHLGDFNGGAAVNFVRERMLGTDVEITIGMGAGPWTVGPSQQVINKKIIDWRMVGLTRIGKLNFVDINPLIAAGLIEAVDSEEVDQPAQQSCPSGLGAHGQDECRSCVGGCDGNQQEERPTGAGVSGIVESDPTRIVLPQVPEVRD